MTELIDIRAIIQLKRAEIEAQMLSEISSLHGDIILPRRWLAEQVWDTLTAGQRATIIATFGEFGHALAFVEANLD